MHYPEFTEQHAALLKSYLTEQPDALSYMQSQGYLFAVICSPDPLEVHQWLEEISPASGGQMDEDVLFAFMGLHHKISEQVFETGYKLPTPLDQKLCQQWSQGFVQGAQLYIDKLMRAKSLTTDLTEALQTAYASLAFFALEPQLIATIAQQNQLSELQLSEQQYELMNDFALGFAELIEIVAVNSGLYSDEGWN